MAQVKHLKLIIGACNEATVGQRIVIVYRVLPAPAQVGQVVRLLKLELLPVESDSADGGCPFFGAIVVIVEVVIQGMEVPLLNSFTICSQRWLHVSLRIPVIIYTSSLLDTFHSPACVFRSVFL